LIVDLDTEFLYYKDKINSRNYMNILKESKLLDIETSSIKYVPRKLFLVSSSLSESKKNKYKRSSESEEGNLAGRHRPLPMVQSYANRRNS
jgi:hypothetical protein